MRFLVYAVLIIIGLFAFGTIFLIIKDYLVSRRRREDKQEDFVNYFVEKGVSQSLALSVYNYFQAWTYIKDFPVRPDDQIDEIYGIVEEDLDDAIIEIAEINGFEVPADTSYWREPVSTVEDLIRFVDSFPGKSSNNQREL